MVPHETVEAAINKVLGLDGEAERRIAVVGVPDEQKGEAILLLSTIAGPALEQECIDLRYKLLDDGLPSLWCPKTIVPVAEIPVLASGKLDIKCCEALAKQNAEEYSVLTVDSRQIHSQSLRHSSHQLSTLNFPHAQPHRLHLRPPPRNPTESLRRLRRRR